MDSEPIQAPVFPYPHNENAAEVAVAGACAHRPAMLGVGEGDGLEPRGRARAPRAPGAAAVGGDEDDAAVATTAGGIAAASVRGAYLHGVLDHPALRSAYPNGLRAGLGPPARKSVAPPVDEDIDRLADHVEAHLDAPLLGRILRLQPLQPSARSTFHVTR